MLGELPRITALKLKKGCGIFLLPTKHQCQCHISFASCNIQHVRNSKLKQMEECPKASYRAISKMPQCSVSYHLISNLLSLQKLYFLQRRNEHKKLTHIFTQLPKRVNPPKCFGKWILETCSLSVPHSVTPIIYCDYGFILHCWIKASTHPQSINLLGLRRIPLLTCATKTEIPEAPGFLKNVTSLLQEIHFSYSLLNVLKWAIISDFNTDIQAYRGYLLTHYAEMLWCSFTARVPHSILTKAKANAHDGGEGRVQNSRCTSCLRDHLKGTVLSPAPQYSAPWTQPLVHFPHFQFAPLSA